MGLRHSSASHGISSAQRMRAPIGFATVAQCPDVAYAEPGFAVFDARDLVARADVPGLHDAEIEARSAARQEGLDERGVAHPDPELEAR